MLFLLLRLFWAAHFQKALDRLGQVQRKVTLDMPCEDKLKKLGMFNLEGEKKSERQHTCVQAAKGCHKEGGQELFFMDIRPAIRNLNAATWISFQCEGKKTKLSDNKLSQ